MRPDDHLMYVMYVALTGSSRSAIGESLDAIAVRPVLLFRIAEIPRPRTVRQALSWLEMRDLWLKRVLRPVYVPVMKRARTSFTAFRRKELRRTPVPRGFNEKVRRKMIFDERAILAVFADKALSREYVLDVLGRDIAPETYAVTRRPECIDWASLPRGFVLKPNHASVAMVFVTEDADPAARLPQDAGATWERYHVHPDSVDPRALVAVGRRWLRRRYGVESMERPYARIEPMVIVEELLRGEGGSVPRDYKFYVFHGACRFIEVHSDRMADHRTDFYTPAWNVLDVVCGKPRSRFEIPKPARLEEMIEIAERLGQDTDFVRVDLYAIGDRIVFGELTNFPGGGIELFEPESFELEAGSYWTLPGDYRRLPDIRRAEVRRLADRMLRTRQRHVLRSGRRCGRSPRQRTKSASAP